HHVKLSVCIRQRFGIPLFKSNLKPLGRRAGSSFLKPVGGNITTDSLCARPRRDHGELPGAATDIEQPGSRCDAEPPEKLLRILFHIAGETVTNRPVFLARTPSSIRLFIWMCFPRC